MKKTLALILTLVLCFSLLTACSNDPTQADFENYLNIETAEVNNNYSAIAEEAGKWGEFTTDAEWVASLQDTLIPLVEDSLAKLAEINPETEKVQALKAKYVSVFEAYKEAFTMILDGVQTVDEAKLTDGNETLNAGVALLDEYNAGLEALAAEFGMAIEY